MPSWQSAIFARLNRLSGPRSLGAGADIEEVRAQYDRLTARFGPVPGDAVFEAAQLGPVKGEWVKVDASASRRLILYFHGGGYVAGSPETHRPLVARVAEHNAGSIRVLEKSGFRVSTEKQEGNDPGDGVKEVLLELPA